MLFWTNPPNYHDTTVAYQIFFHLWLLGWVFSVIAFCFQLIGIYSRQWDKMFPGTKTRDEPYYPQSNTQDGPYYPQSAPCRRRSNVHVGGSAPGWSHGL
jgi:hypothetical protein